MKYDIDKNIFDGPHTLLCSLESWAELWFLPPNIIDKIKIYMPIIAHKCNMVSNYSRESFKRNISKKILNYVNDFELHESIFEEEKLVGEFYAYKIPNRNIEGKSKYQDILIVIGFKDIEIYIWRK